MLIASLGEDGFKGLNLLVRRDIEAVVARVGGGFPEDKKYIAIKFAKLVKSCTAEAWKRLQGRGGGFEFAPGQLILQRQPCSAVTSQPSESGCDHTLDGTYEPVYHVWW